MTVVTWMLMVVAMGTVGVAGTFMEDLATHRALLVEEFGDPLERVMRSLPSYLSHLKMDSMTSAVSDINLGLLYLPSMDPNLVKNPQCRIDVSAIVDALTKPSILIKPLWSLELVDSWGKLPDGMASGNVRPWGMLEECTTLNVNATVTSTTEVNQKVMTQFRGKYCLVRYMAPIVNSSDTSKTPAVAPLLPGVALSYGTCMPSSCTSDDLLPGIKSIMQPGKLEVLTIDCQTADQVIELQADEIVFVVFLTVFGLLLLVAGMVDILINHFDQQDLRKGFLKYLLVFSAYTNLQKIFHIEVKKNPDTISCLHGMRVLSMTWVVWVHCYVILFNYEENVLTLPVLLDDPIEQTIFNGSLSVDSFFFLSGLLVALGLLKQFQKAGRVNWVMYYVHRVIRLTPPILIATAAVATLPPLIMYGPMAGQVKRTMVQTCKEYWWKDVLYINNIPAIPGADCLPQCWYTAVDTQIYLVLPLVLLPLMYKPKIGLVWLSLVTSASIAIPATIIAVNEFQPTLSPIMSQSLQMNTDYSNMVYMAPWCRASPYFVGIWCGYLLFVTHGTKVALKPWQVFLGWGLAVLVALLTLYGLSAYNTYDNPKEVTTALRVLYGGTNRATWALALLWVVFACHHGYGGPVNSFLSHPSFQPLSRITYCLFLTSIPIQFIYGACIYRPLYYNHLNKIIEVCGFLFIGGLLAIVLSLLTEGPILGLEKLLLRRPDQGLDNKKAT